MLIGGIQKFTVDRQGDEEECNSFKNISFINKKSWQILKMFGNSSSRSMFKF